MINEIIVLAIFTGEAIPCFIWYKIGLKKGRRDMVKKLNEFWEKLKKEKGLDHD